MMYHSTAAHVYHTHHTHVHRFCVVAQASTQQAAAQRMFYLGSMWEAADRNAGYLLVRPKVR